MREIKNEKKINPMDLNYKYIKVEELKCEYLEEKDRRNFKKVKKNFTSPTIGIIMILASLIPAMIIKVNISRSIEIKELGFSIIAFLVFFLFGVYKIYISIQLNRIEYKKLQYGIVKNKYVIKNNGADGNTNEVYYINVIFKEENKYLGSVICKWKDYKAFKEGDKVLVASFDEKIAYAVPVEN